MVKLVRGGGPTCHPQRSQTPKSGPFKWPPAEPRKPAGCLCLSRCRKRLGRTALSQLMRVHCVTMAPCGACVTMQSAWSGARANVEGPRPVWNWAGTGAPGRGPQASVNPVALAGGGKAGRLVTCRRWSRPQLARMARPVHHF
ncbi:hypothetical protein KIL84_021096 [Mauremys mutica]|uniref:Uncharacterized protein n=1 Tax=Mauremys mutica TaxID=74926 RepID=A0A9D3XAB8_9SAUR|nr:hypothetical protein KIL84_021096 [Mauremys mutica]